MSETQQTKIQVRGLSKVFGNQPKKALELRDKGKSRGEILEQTGQTLGLSNVSFDVQEGELLVIMGLSGSGKSTLIRCLNRLIEPTEGEIVIDGENIPTLSEKELLHCRRRHFSMVFQNFALFPHRTVQQNAEYGLEVRGVDKQERTRRASDALKQRISFSMNVCGSEITRTRTFAQRTSKEPAISRAARPNGPSLSIQTTSPNSFELRAATPSSDSRADQLKNCCP